jgi:Domain of unknown function (DUF4082)/Bacterial Ig-like domain/Bacterial Ig domain
MGYYGGEGARKVDTVQPSAPLPQAQPPCDTKPSTGLVDCGNWGESASWEVPADAVSGIYFAKLVRDDEPSSEGSHVLFVVRDDGGDSDLLFQTSDTTWEAYNHYGGNSLYEGGPGINPGRAYEVSYNRPLTTRGTTPEDAPFAAEYPLVRWLERNGYDVSYFTGVDAARSGDEVLDHEAYLSVGHDEYWSGEQRENVEAARDAGVDLAFFSGNELFWKTRWEESIDGSGTDYRTLVCFKETHANAKIDPEADVWTGTWRDPRFSPPADGGQPENSLTGAIFTVNSGTGAIEVPAAYGKMRLWRHTSVASLAPGQTATLANATLGYEWDEDLDNGFRPAGLAHLSSTTMEVPERVLDYGSNYGPATATHHLTLYRAPSGALVFGAGTVQWSWGLDPEHDREGPDEEDPRMQQATVNLFADMGVQPGTLQEELEPAAETTDTTPPTTTIDVPADGSQVESGKPLTISGTANDTPGEGEGGRVAGVEVSTDGGTSWHPANGLDQWTYKWTPGKTGDADVLARAVDDSANLEQPGDDAGVEVIPHTCPCSIWDESFSAPEDADSSAVEVGVKFRADTDGYIAGLRFYKTAGNTGTHVGRLWTAAGTPLAVATFANETSSGWQQINFETPVQITADTTYVASYHAPNGHYAAFGSYFTLTGADSAPLHALANGVDGPNGIFKRGSAGGLFSGGGPDTFGAANYLVDVVFEKELPPDTTAPEVTAVSPVSGATDIGTDTVARATFSEQIDAATIDDSTLELRDGSSDPVPASLSYDPAKRVATIHPDDPLLHSTTYTASLSGGPGGIADLAGNPLTGNESWSFTTAAAPPPPPDEGSSGGPILVISNAASPFSRYYAEILRAEGLNEFTATDISSVTPAVLGAHDVAILGEGGLSAAQAQMLSSWVEAGGNLIAMRPDAQLASLLGLSPAGGILANAYLKVDTATTPGAGIVGQTMQFHGTADRYLASDAQTIATLYGGAEGPATANPAVTLRNVGSNGGHAAAFSYDLAKSVLYTRQGNRAWAGEDRDGVGPIRPDDLFFGAKKGDERPDWVDLSKVRIPQADEQQRLLTNLIERMNMGRKPLPRFWFLPRDERAAVVMTGDDHGLGGVAARLNQYEADSPPGCSVANWECVRATAYIYPSTPIGDAQAAAYTASGFEIGLHVTTDCSDWADRAELESVFSTQLTAFAAKFPSLPSPSSERTHCVVWSDWASQPKVELQNGIRLDTNYYYWPSTWVGNRPGMFTGSGMPMRFADLDGSTIDVYQAPTQLTDESGQTYPFTIDTLLDGALGPTGYYGVFTANMQSDHAASSEATEIVASAKARGVPIVSARQMLTWLDARNQSSFDSLEWEGRKLTFTIDPGAGANGLRAMLPVGSSAGDLLTLERGGSPMPTTTQTIKGIEYAFFDATAAAYTATYGPELTATAPSSPSNVSTPKVIGSAPAGSTVRIHAGTDCTVAPLATGSAAQLASGIAVTVPEDATTQLRATTTSTASGVSSCSAPLTYVEDSTPPATQIDTHSVGPVTSSTAAAFAFSAADPGGTGVALFECRLDSGEASAWAPCTSPKSYASLGDGVHSFEVRAVDVVGNADASPASFAWRVDTAAPDTQVDTGPPNPSASAKADFAFSGTDPGGSGVATYQCRRDSSEESGWQSCSSPQSYASLADGTHKFEVRAIDQAGNVDASPAAFSWAIDTVAPDTQIDDGPPSLTASTGAKFEFSGSDPGGSGVVSYQCRRDSSEESAWGTCSSPQSHASLADGSHGFEVRAIDNAGNVDQSPAVFDWTVDATAPDTQIDDGPPDFYASAAAQFAFSGTDPGGSGVASYQCRRDSAEPSAWQSCSSPKSYSSLADGAHEFEVRAVDQAGNPDPSPAVFAWTVDTTAPQTQIDAGPDALSASAGAKFEFSGSDASGSGVASFECRRDSSEASAWGPCSSPRIYASLTDGAHRFEVRAVDRAGNLDTSPGSFEWSIDTTAPQTQIDAGPDALSASAAAELKFSGADAGGSGVGSYECRRDSAGAADWQACGSPKQYAALLDGGHTFEVRAIDQAGNVDPSPAAFAWTIDTTAPDTQIGGHPEALEASASATFAFSGSDGAGSGVSSYECRRDSTEAAAWGPCASPREYSSLADGAHKFEVRAVDQAGNVDATPAAFEWSVDTTAPDTQIDGHPEALEASASASFAFSGSDGSGSGVASFECRRDSTQASDWKACGSPQSYSSLADGPHKFEVRAIDKAGNVDASPASFGWSIDTTAPNTQIDGHPLTLEPTGTTIFVFSATDGVGSGVASYECRRDSSQAADWEGCSSPKSYHSLADGSHGFEVRAIDAAGNVDASAATFSWSVDTTAPETQITAHPDALSASTSAGFAFSGSDGSGSGVASYQCRRDSSEESGWGACSSPQTYASLADGAHAFEVRAIDQAGNVDQTPASFAWSIDATKPDTQIDVHPRALEDSAAASFEFSGSDPGGSGVASYQCRRDSTEASAWAACGSPKGYASLADGAHRFEVRAVDQAGNADPSPASFEWTIDTTAPQTQIDAGPDALSASAAAEFEFSASDGSGSGVASYECRRDDAGPSAWQPCNSPSEYAALAEGAHDFEVRAIDQAENVDPSPADFVWAVDTIAPTVAIDSLSRTLVGPGQSSEVRWHADENGEFELRVGGTDCDSGTVLDSGTYATQPAERTSTVAADDLSEGSNVLRLCLTDAASNRDSTTATLSRDTTPPETQIDAHPDALSASASASFEFSGSDGSGSGVSSYQCRRDSTEESAWTLCASPQGYASLADGSHAFQVRAIDQAGNVDGSPAAFGWTIDTTPPASAIDSGPNGVTNRTSPTFAFHASEAGSSFECSIDTGTPAFGPCSNPGSHTPSSPLADGPYTFRVRATDAAGNVGASATRSFTVDTLAPPAPELTSTVPASPANENSPKIVGMAEPGSTVRLYTGADCLDSPLDTVSAAQLAAGVVVSVPDNSTSTFSANATTEAGNLSPCSEPLTYLEDSNAPSTQIDGHPANPASSALTIFAFSGDDPSGSGVAAFQCRLDSSQEADWEACGSPESYGLLSEGDHEFEVRAIDAAGNVDPGPASYAWTIDTVAPETHLLSHPEALSASTSAQFKFSGEDGGTGVTAFECRRDSQAAIGWQPCSSPKSYTLLADGIHRFEVRAMDGTGNVDPSPASFEWRIDTTPPETQIDAHPETLTSSASAQFAFSGNDVGGSGVVSFECRRDSFDPGFWGPCTSPLSYSSLPNGPHAFRVRAIDQAGNVDGSPAAFGWTIDTTLQSTGTGTTSTTTRDVVHILQIKYDKRRKGILLVVKVPGPGKLSVNTPEPTRGSGKGAGASAIRPRPARQIEPKSVRTKQAGKVKLRVKLSPSSRQLLLEDHRVTVKVQISFESTDGTYESRTISVTLKQRQPPPAREQ